MPIKPPIVTAWFALTVLAQFTGTALLAQQPEVPVDFVQEIAPIFADHCVRCHNSDEQKGKFSLSSGADFFKKRPGHEAVVQRGDADGSLLVELITPARGGAEPEMPEEGDPLTVEQTALIRRWIDEGANWPEGAVVQQKPKAEKNTWWSLQPLRKTAPPEVISAPKAWSGAIDRFVFARLAEKGLKPSAPADRPTLIRRATYDLTGLPPTPEEVEAFVADTSADAYPRLIERLLESPRYGERWGRHWLDVIRFGESQGFERNLIRDDAWPVRDYVIRSINEDKPFDRFISEHLAGDQLAPGDPAVEVGTGFLVAGPYDNVGNQDPKAAAQIRSDTLDEIVSTTGSAFLGITLGCARCHDHKFDPIPQADYYRVQAAFSGVEQAARELGTAEQRQEIARKLGTIEKARAGVKAEIAALEKTGKQLDAAQQQRREDLQKQKAALDDEKKHLPKLPSAWIGQFKQPAAAAYLMRGGDPQKRGPEIAPASLAVLDHCTTGFVLPLNAAEGQRRLALAKWIVAADNPLTPRVLANRVWHYHFGTGIVDTPSDFGYMGGKPTHPELLDYLALRLKEHGWRLKPLHREIMLSATYQQASRWEKSAADVDAAARLLWRFPPRRLSAEELRDTMLAVAGKLNLEAAGGPGFRLYKYVNDNVSTYIPLEKVGPETYRRAVYHQNARASVVDLISDFDAPDCAFSTPRRASTTTPLQALTLFNHSFTIDLAQHFAERLRREAGEDAAAQVRRAFALIAGRTTTTREEETARTLIREHGLPAFCRALLNSNELAHVR